MRTTVAVVALALALCTGRWGRAQPDPEPGAEGMGVTPPASQPAAPASQPASAPSSRPASQPTVTVTPPPQPCRPAFSGPGEPCTMHSDCQRPLWCIERLCTVATGAGGGAKQRLNRKGNVRVGGGLAVAPASTIPEQGDPISGTTLAISPALGYFLLEGLELGFLLEVGVGFGELYKDELGTVLLGPTVRYVFGGEHIMPFIGLMIGPQFLLSEDADTRSYVDLMLQVGLLVPLNEQVGLSFGARPTFAFGVGDGTGMLINVPIGWLGVEAFF